MGESSWQDLLPRLQAQEPEAWLDFDEHYPSKIREALSKRLNCRNNHDHRSLCLESALVESRAKLPSQVDRIKDDRRAADPLYAYYYTMVRRAALQCILEDRSEWDSLQRHLYLEIARRLRKYEQREISVEQFRREILGARPRPDVARFWDQHLAPYDKIHLDLPSFVEQLLRVMGVPNQYIGELPFELDQFEQPDSLSDGAEGHALWQEVFADELDEKQIVEAFARRTNEEAMKFFKSLRLSDEQLSALILTKVLDLKDYEAAAYLKKNVKAIESRLKRARKRIDKKILQGKAAIPSWLKKRK